MNLQEKKTVYRIAQNLQDIDAACNSGKITCDEQLKRSHAEITRQYENIAHQYGNGVSCDLVQFAIATLSNLGCCIQDRPDYDPDIHGPPQNVDAVIQRGLDKLRLELSMRLI